MGQRRTRVHKHAPGLALRLRVVYLDRLLDDAPRLVLEQLAVGRHEDELQPALQDLLKRLAVAHRLGYLGVAAAHLPGGSTAIIARSHSTAILKVQHGVHKCSVATQRGACRHGECRGRGGAGSRWRGSAR